MTNKLVSKSIFLSLLFIAVALFVFFVNTSTAMAQSNGALTIIPPKFELFSNPGETSTQVIRIRNESTAPATYTMIVEDFTTAGEEGQVILEEGESDTSYSLAKWIELSTKDIILQPNEEKNVAFVVNTPIDAEPGGHYASILFKTGGTEDVKGGASVTNRIGSLVLLRVSGNVTEDAEIETFSAPKFLNTGPVPILLRLKNNGNAHIIPKGTIVITNTFGKKVDEIPLTGKNVLPGATRKMETLWEKNKLLGNYTATLIATYGQQNKPLTGVVKFTVISKTALIVGFIALFSLVGLIMTIIFGRERLSKVFSVLFKG